MVRVRLTSSLAGLAAAVLAGGVLAAASLQPAGDLQAGPPAADPAPVPTSGDSVVLPPAVVQPKAAPPPSPSRVPAPSPTVVPRTAPPAQRVTVRTAYAAYAQAGPVVLHFPGDVVEVVGLHQSGHDGAQPQSPVGSVARIGLLGSRSRDTNPQGAADIVVDPTRPVRAPVTGTVVRAGSYTLYCDHVDDYVVVAPDAQPEWEVKLLHFEGLSVRKGDRVEAGVTVVGKRARVLPFASQVDKHTVAPHWPHLHVEVVDPRVPNRPSGGSCD